MTKDEKTIQGFIDLASYGIKTSVQEVLDFFDQSSLIKKNNLVEQAKSIMFSNDKIIFHNLLVNSYIASITADFLCRKLLEQKKFFTFEPDL